MATKRNTAPAPEQDDVSAKSSLWRKLLDGLTKDANAKLEPQTTFTNAAQKTTPAHQPPSIAKELSPPAALRSVEASIEGLRLHAVERTGAAPSRAVILIHGAGLDHRDWTFDFIKLISPDWRVLAFDRPGFGRSERPNVMAGALPTTQARLLRGAAMQLGVREAVVVGHSWGGAVAMAWALQSQEELIGVVSLAGAVAPWSLSSSIAHARRMRSAARMALKPGGMNQAALEALTESFNPDPIPAGYLDHIATDFRRLTAAAAATAQDVSTINGALGMLTQQYDQITKPVELVYGDADNVLSAEEQGEVASKLLQNANLTKLTGVGHMVHHSSPRDCLSAISRLTARA